MCLGRRDEEALSTEDPMKNLGHPRKQENKKGLGGLNLSSWILSAVENKSSLQSVISLLKHFVLEWSTSWIKKGVWDCSISYMLIHRQGPDLWASGLLVHPAGFSQGGGWRRASTLTVTLPQCLQVPHTHQTAAIRRPEGIPKGGKVDRVK